MNQVRQHGVLQRFLLVLMVATVFFAGTGCALIIDGKKEPEERSSEVLWGYFVLDLVFTGGIGLIIDFVTGAIYKKKSAGYLSPEGCGSLLDMCSETTQRAKQSSRKTIDEFQQYLADHLGICPTCRLGLVEE